MTNREWLNTLSDEKYLKKITDVILKEYCFDRDVPSYFHANFLNLCDYLQQPHETSADEDFVEIGFKESGKEKYGHIQYIDKHLRVVNIFKDKETVYWTNSYLMDSRGWTDELIDAVRPIAEKKRKEVWG